MIGGRLIEAFQAQCPNAVLDAILGVAGHVVLLVVLIPDEGIDVDE